MAQFTCIWANLCAIFVMVWYGMVWYMAQFTCIRANLCTIFVMVWYGMAQFTWIQANLCAIFVMVVWYGMVWYGAVLLNSSQLVRYICYGMVWLGMVWCILLVSKPTCAPYLLWYGKVWYGSVSSLASGQTWVQNSWPALRSQSKDVKCCIVLLLQYSFSKGQPHEIGIVLTFFKCKVF